MITTNGDGYWATGITVRWRDYTGTRNDVRHGGWDAWLDFYDDGFNDDDPDAGSIATEGTLRTRYGVRNGEQVTGLRAAIDALIADAQRLGVRLRAATTGPTLYYHRDGEDQNFPPPDGWRELLAAEATRLGWDFPSMAKEG